MTAIEISFILIGILLLVGSFFVSEKLSSSDIEELKRLSEQELKIILEQSLKAANAEIDDRLESVLDEKQEELERRIDKDTNQKLMSIGEYADTVLSSMNTSHDEIVFLYDMLNDKQEKLTSLTRDLQHMESDFLQLGEAVEEKLAEAAVILDKKLELAEPEVAPVPAEPIAVEEALLQKEADVLSKDVNKQILDMYEAGATEVEIAKTLGRGLGEVKLVLGLFKERRRV